MKNPSGSLIVKSINDSTPQKNYNFRYFDNFEEDGAVDKPEIPLASPGFDAYSVGSNTVDMHSCLRYRCANFSSRAFRRWAFCKILLK